MRKRWFRQLLRRRVFVILLLVLQGLVLIGLISNASSIARWINTAFRLLSILVGLRVVSSRDKPTYKLLWIVLILVFPVFGGLLYLLVTFQSSTRWVARRLGELEAALEQKMDRWVYLNDLAERIARGLALCEELQAKATGDVVIHQRLRIRTAMLRRGIRLYRLAYERQLGAMLAASKTPDPLGEGGWTDLCGLYMPVAVVNALLEAIADGSCASLEHVTAALRDADARYPHYAAGWALARLTEQLGHTPTPGEIETARAAGLAAAEQLDARLKDFAVGIAAGGEIVDVGEIAQPRALRAQFRRRDARARERHIRPQDDEPAVFVRQFEHLFLPDGAADARIGVVIFEARRTHETETRRGEFAVQARFQRVQPLTLVGQNVPLAFRQSEVSHCDPPPCAYAPVRASGRAPACFPLYFTIFCARLSMI